MRGEAAVVAAAEAICSGQGVGGARKNLVALLPRGGCRSWMRAFGSQPSPTLCSPHAVSWSDSSRRTSWRTRERPNRHGHVARARSSGRPTSLTRRLDDQGVPFRTITAIFASVWVLSELQGTEVDKKDPAGYEITEKSNNKSSEVWQGYQHAAAVAAEG